jgi:hypothetical protein
MILVPLRRLPYSSQVVPIKLLAKVTKLARFVKLSQALFDFMQIPMVVLASRNTDEPGTLPSNLTIRSRGHSLIFT